MTTINYQRQMNTAFTTERYGLTIDVIYETPTGWDYTLDCPAFGDVLHIAIEGKLLDADYGVFYDSDSALDFVYGLQEWEVEGFRK